MRLFSLIIVSLTLASCSAVQSPPQFALSIPPAFSGQTEHRTFRRGAPLTDKDSMFRAMFPDHRAEQPMRVIYGRWTDPSFISYPAHGTYYGSAKHRDWFIEVQRGASAKVLRAFQSKDGYEADLGFTLNASARIYPRFQHKRFSWGQAVSFLVQYQNDNTNYVPNNGMMLYEVHGVTTDQLYSVRAQFGITHPRLVEFGPGVRNHDDDAPMRRDPHYRLVERCPDDAFQPSIKDIDAMLDTLKPNAP